MFAFYYNIINKDVVDRQGCVIGRPHDFLVQLGGAYPMLTTLILKRGLFKKEYTAISWGNIKKLDEQIHLNLPEEHLVYGPHYKIEDQTSIKDAILDQQVVDTFNRKVVRVNDIHFLRVGRDLRIAHVDVGFRAIIRRLGLEKYVDFAVRLLNQHSRYLTKEHLISWKFVQPLDVQPKKGTLKLNVSEEDLIAIPPADLSEIIDDLDAQERVALFKVFDFETQVDVLNEMDVDLQKDMISELDPQVAIKLIENMDYDEAADLLGTLSKKEAGRILSMLSPAKARKLYSLLKYESDSAGGLMMVEFVKLFRDMTVAEAMEKIKALELDAEMIYYAYVISEEGRLQGRVTFRELIQSEPDAKIGDVMSKRPVKVSVHADAREVAYLMEKYDLLAIPVVDDDEIVKGVIAIDDMLAMVIEETWGEKPGIL